VATSIRAKKTALGAFRSPVGFKRERERVNIENIYLQARAVL